jgi:hypothetical protein
MEGTVSAKSDVYGKRSTWSEMLGMVLARLLVVTALLTSLFNFLFFAFYWPVQLIVMLPLLLWGSSRQLRWRAEELLLPLFPMTTVFLLSQFEGIHRFQWEWLYDVSAWVIALLGMTVLLPRVFQPAASTSRLRWMVLGCAVAGAVIASAIYLLALKTEGTGL